MLGFLARKNANAQSEKRETPTPNTWPFSSQARGQGSGRDYLRIVRCQVNRLISKLWGEVGQVPVTFQAGFVGWRDLLLLQLYGTRTSQQAFLLQAKARGQLRCPIRTTSWTAYMGKHFQPPKLTNSPPMPSNSSSGALGFEGTTCH